MNAFETQRVFKNARAARATARKATALAIARREQRMEAKARDVEARILREHRLAMVDAPSVTDHPTSGR